MAPGSRGTAALGASRQSLSVMMETLLQERHGGHDNRGCHQILSADAGKSQARGLQADSRQLVELELPLQTTSGRGEVSRGELQAGWEPAVGHAGRPSPCTCMHHGAILPALPTSTQQLITTDCLLILIPLGQGCPASQTALCPASCNSHSLSFSQVPRAAVSLEGQLLHCGSEVQGKTATFHPSDRPHAGCLPEKALTPPQLFSGKESVPLS